MTPAGIAFAVGSVLGYVGFGARLARPFGATWGERARALLARREPSVFLDSARAVVLVAWMRNVPDIPLVVDNLHRRVPWIEPVGIFRWIDPYAFPPGAMPLLVWVMRAALLLAVIGVLARGALVVAAAAHTLLWSVAYSTVGSSVHNHVVFFVLLTLALSPEPYVPLWRYFTAYRRGAPLVQVGSYPEYLRWAAMFSVATVYVQPGIEKVLHGGLPWFNGTTLAGHALRKGQLSTGLASLPLLVLTLFAIVVVVWETGYGVVLFYPRLRWLGVLTGWGFHEFVRRGMGVTPFFFMEVALLFLVTPYEAWDAIARRLRRRPPEGVSAGAGEAGEGAPSVRAGHAAAIAALLVISWVPTVIRRGTYPLLGNAMFSTSLVDGRLVPAESHLFVRDAAGVERKVWAQDGLAIHTETLNELVFVRYLSPYKPRTPFPETKDEYCQILLDHLCRYGSPDAAALVLRTDLFVVPSPHLETREVWTCTPRS